jgi:3-oxoacyl-[acyl-carrier protein] reductase
MITPILLMRAVVDGMIARKFGRIVNITSGAVKAPIPELGLSNGARTGSPASSPGSRARRCATTSPSTACCPARSRPIGCVPTSPSTPRTPARRSKSCARPARARIPPVGSARSRKFGDACAYLCSAQAGYITGQNLLLDGGSYPGTF